MISVVATIQTEPGRRSDVLEQFARIVSTVRAEGGCLIYTPSIDVTTNIDAQVGLRDDVITVVEQWESLEALEVHLMAPHMLAFRQAVKEWVKSVSLQIVEPV